MGKLSDAEQQQAAPASLPLAQRQAKAVQDFRAAPEVDGNRAFFLLAMKVKSLDKASLRKLLEYEAAHAHSPDERLREIDGLVVKFGT